MPRRKGFRRSQAAKRRMANQIINPPLHQAHGKTVTTVGTGVRHRARQWPTSLLTGKCHKLVIPPLSPDKKFVVLLGDSHLRHIADGFVQMPEGCLSFGVSSTPGATAAELEIEVKHTMLPRTPDLVCLLAPSNNLTASRTIPEAAGAFSRLLDTVCSRWLKVCVLDFPPRLTVEEGVQTLLRQEYHRVSARMGIRYFSVAEHFPLDRLELWCKDGVHLSDDVGMDIFAQLLWLASFQMLDTSAPPTPVAPRWSPPTGRVCPRVVVVGPVPAPPTTSTGRKRKRVSPKNSDDDLPLEDDRPEGTTGRTSSGRWVPQLQQVESVLSPDQFSSAVLVEMDKLVPSDLSSARCRSSSPAGQKGPHAVGQNGVATQRSRPWQKRAAARVVDVVAGPPTSIVRVEEEQEQKVVGVTPDLSTTSVVMDVRLDEDESEDVWTAPSSTLKVTQKDQVLPFQHMPPAVRRVREYGEHSKEKCAHIRPDIGLAVVSKRLDAEADVFEKASEAVLCSSVRVPGSIRGSFRQGGGRFKYDGVQCMAIALVGIAKHSVCSVLTWEPSDLDRVLDLGDEVYKRRRSKALVSDPRGYLCVNDLPNYMEIDGQMLQFSFEHCVTGKVNVNEGESIDAGVSLEAGLKMMTWYKTCLLTVCSNTFAIICDNGCYALVDSHSHSARGMVDGRDGRSIVVYFGCITDLYSHICDLAECLSSGNDQKRFEITEVQVSVVCEGHRGVKWEQAGEGLGSVEEMSHIVVRHHELKKLKHSFSPEVSIGLRPVAGVQASPEVVYPGEEVNGHMFAPLSEVFCRALCILLNIEFEKFNVQVRSGVGVLGVPCLNERIVADGNCFFRAVSQAISGTQKFHRRIRLAVVKYVETNAVKYQGCLKRKFTSVVDYVNKSKMRYVNNGATELQIQALADCLGIDVFTFVAGQWLRYVCRDNRLSSQAIYLECCQGSHYETVICARKGVGQGCHGLCKTTTSDLRLVRSSVEKGYYVTLSNGKSVDYTKS